MFKETLLRILSGSHFYSGSPMKQFWTIYNSKLIMDLYAVQSTEQT